MGTSVHRWMDQIRAFHHTAGTFDRSPAGCSSSWSRRPWRRIRSHGSLHWYSPVPSASLSLLPFSYVSSISHSSLKEKIPETLLQNPPSGCSCFRYIYKVRCPFGHRTTNLLHPLTPSGFHSSSRNYLYCPDVRTSGRSRSPAAASGFRSSSRSCPYLRFHMHRSSCLPEL